MGGPDSETTHSHASYRVAMAPGADTPPVSRLPSARTLLITGGVVIHDPKLPAWKGRYVFGDYCRGVVQLARLPHGKARDTALKVKSLTSFGEDASGHVYAASQNGPVYRLVAR